MLIRHRTLQDWRPQCISELATAINPDCWNAFAFILIHTLKKDLIFQKVNLITKHAG